MAALAEEQSMLLSAPRALNLFAVTSEALNSGDANTWTLRVLTQECEDLTLVSLNYPSPLAEYVPQML